MPILLLGALACGVQQEHYDTAEIARRMGAGQRGLLPAFLPDTASEVHIVNNTNTGGVWIWSTLDRQAQAELRARVTKVGWGQAAANTTTPPFTSASPKWNPILGGALMYTPPGPPTLYFVSGDWHGIAEPDGKCWITLTRPKNARNLPRQHATHHNPHGPNGDAPPGRGRVDVFDPGPSA